MALAPLDETPHDESSLELCINRSSNKLLTAPAALRAPTGGADGGPPYRAACPPTIAPRIITTPAASKSGHGSMRPRERPQRDGCIGHHQRAPEGHLLSGGGMGTDCPTPRRKCDSNLKCPEGPGHARRGHAARANNPDWPPLSQLGTARWVETSLAGQPGHAARHHGTDP